MIYIHLFVSHQVLHPQTVVKDALAEAQALPESEWPSPARPAVVPGLKDAVSAAMKKVEERAGEVHVAPTVLATRAQVTAWLERGDASEGAPSDWRWDVIGRELVEQSGIGRQQTLF